VALDQEKNLERDKFNPPLYSNILINLCKVNPLKTIKEPLNSQANSKIICQLKVQQLIQLVRKIEAIVISQGMTISNNLIFSQK
jgi:predicted permease